MTASSSMLCPTLCNRGLWALPPSETTLALEQRLATFCAHVSSLHVDENDANAATRLYVTELARKGFLQAVLPAPWGGSGAGPGINLTRVCIIRQWLARTSAALDTAFVMQGLGSYAVTQGGSDRLKETLLPKVASGQAICAFALTEKNAGSDIQNMQTLAHDNGDHFILAGEKCFISNAPIADNFVVFAREAKSVASKPRFGAFFVPRDTVGLTVSPIDVIAPHPIGTLGLTNVRVPKDARLGGEGQGLALALGTLDVFRTSVGAAALGLADRALMETIAHLQQREQFGTPLASQQGLRMALADVLTAHEAAQLLVYNAAAAHDAGSVRPEQVAMAKLFATESAQRCVDRAVQTFGGRGVTVGEVPERLYREVRALRIYEGTSEIQKLIIARAALGR